MRVPADAHPRALSRCLRAGGTAIEYVFFKTFEQMEDKLDALIQEHGRKLLK
jgi:hypothetical protein